MGRLPVFTSKMMRLRPGNTTLNLVLLLYWLSCFGVSSVSSITVTTPAELHASKGDTVALSCTFTSTSTPTSKMSVDWSYRPQSGGSPHTFFHFSSRAFLPPDGQFGKRILWKGSPARGDVSIALVNATLNDNGTFTCSVRNPPDVHGSPTSQTVLTVVPKAPRIRITDVAFLLTFVLIPSGLITVVLIGRMFCHKEQHIQSKTYRSPIEVTEGEEYSYIKQRTKEKRPSCYELCLMDSDDEYFNYNIKTRPPADDDYVESRC